MINELQELAEQSAFRMTGTLTQTEKVKSKDGSTIERTFTTITLEG